MSKGGHGGQRRGSGRKRKHFKPSRWCIYVIHEADAPETCKVGISGIAIGLRLSALQIGNWRPLVIDRVIEIGTKTEAVAVEDHVHAQLRSRRLLGEWFRVDVYAAIEMVEKAALEKARLVKQDKFKFG